MSATGDMVRAQQQILKEATQAEAQQILTQLQEEQEEVTDTFFTQEATIESLTELMKVQDQKVTYISPPAPTPVRSNYILYAAIGLAALIIFKKVKL